MVGSRGRGRGIERGEVAIELGNGAAHHLWRSDWAVIRDKGKRERMEEERRERERKRRKRREGRASST